MKVVQIFLNRYGGTLKCSVKLAEELANNVELKAFVSTNAEGDILKDNPYYRKIKTGNGAIGNVLNTLNPINYKRILKDINAYKPDVIHFPIEHAWNFIFLIALKNFPIVQTIHDPIRHAGEENLIYDYLRHLAIQRADRIVVLSKQFKGIFKKFGINQDQVDVIPHGSFSFENKIPEPPLNKNVLFAGRINKYKGLDVLLKAFLIVQKGNPDAKLTIAGKGDMSPYQCILNDLENIILINRYLTEDELKKLHSDCDFVVVPYIEASQSGVIALAASNGRLIVSTNVGGLAEQVIDGDTGFLVEKNNPQALADKINILFDNKELILKMGENASNYYKDNYSWSAIAKKYIKTYTEANEKFNKKTRISIIKSSIKNMIKEKNEK